MMSISNRNFHTFDLQLNKLNHAQEGLPHNPDIPAFDDTAFCYSTSTR